MKYLITGLALLVSFGVSASEVTDKIQQQYPTEYAELSESCNQWADEENERIPHVWSDDEELTYEDVKKMQEWDKEPISPKTGIVQKKDVIASIVESLNTLPNTKLGEVASQVTGVDVNARSDGRFNATKE